MLAFRRVSLFFAALLATSSARAEEVLRVTGTGTALGTMRLLGAAFEKANPGHSVRILASIGSGGAIKAVADGALDLGLSGRPLLPEETALGVVAFAYARTPFVFAAGPRSGASGVTAEQLVRIYRGETTTWPMGERVRLVLRPRADADSALVAAISPEMRDALEAAYSREGLLVAATNQECDELLARTPGAIGPSSLAQIVTEKRPLTMLAWNGVAPTVRNLDSGAYPLSKSLLAVVRVPLSARVRRFLAFLGSPGARKILEETGNLPVPLPPLE